MGIETICLQEAAYLIRRSPKYWVVVGHMYLSGLRNPLQSKVFRAAYFFCRHIDDVLDGDKEISGDPRDYVHTILEGMNGGTQTPKIVDLYEFVIGQMGNNGTHQLQSDFKRVIEVMLFDYERSKERRVLTKQELDDYFVRTFVPVLNISLQIGESELRGNDLLEIVLTMGHIYSIRDLSIDLPRGVINIPQEKLELSGRGCYVSYDTVLNDSNLLGWMDGEIRKYHKILAAGRDRLEEAGDKGSRRICFPLIGAMERYCKRYLRERV